jgi:2-polyprenyl-6-methoxyphenol hydroxylase-like FAD-dependent oxidoreductase
MNLGLRDIKSLLAVLDSELASADPGQAILMQAYVEKRRADVIAFAAFTESMVTAFGCDFPGARWLRGGLWKPCRSCLTCSIY